MSELIEAIQAGDVARVSQLLERDPRLGAQQESGVTPLLTAIYHGKHDVAQLLVASGVPVSVPEACALGELERVTAMVAADPALVNARSADGHTALGLAIFFRRPTVARFLIEQGADVGAVSENAQSVAPVHAAAAVCDRETMELLLARGADVNARQQGGVTALHGAASRGDMEMARLLLDHGAARDAQTAEGLSVAAIARKYGHDGFAAWIGDAGSPG